MLTRPFTKKNGAESLLEAVGAELKTLRQSKGISQRYLGWKAGYGQNYISDVERGSRNVGITVVFDLLDALDVSPSDFFTTVSKRIKR